MSFWSSQTLAVRLPSLVRPFTAAQIDCNAYTLRIGDEYYVSPNDQTPDPRSQSIRRLGSDEAFTIPPGQFAFLITDEIVQIPPDAMAFISIRAKIKFRGLINVSGFHVDPGYSGRLTFSVFNAGPAVIHLSRGQACFLIWFASLDQETEQKKKVVGSQRIAPEWITGIAGELQSFDGLQRKISDVERKLNERLNRLEPQHAALVTRITILVALAASIFAYIARDAILSSKSSNPTVISQPNQPAGPNSTNGQGQGPSIW